MSKHRIPFFRSTKSSDAELWEAFASDGRGADYVDGNIVEIETRVDAETLLSELIAIPEHRRPELLIQMLRTEIIKNR